MVEGSQERRNRQHSEISAEKRKIRHQRRKRREFSLHFLSIVMISILQSSRIRLRSFSPAFLDVAEAWSSCNTARNARFHVNHQRILHGSTFQGLKSHEGPVMPFSKLHATIPGSSEDISARKSGAKRTPHSPKISIDKLDMHEIDGNSSDDASEIQTMDPKTLLKTWRALPQVNPRITFPTLVIPASDVQQYMQHTELQPLLAKPSNWDFLQHVHPRIKLIQNYNQTHKQLLLLPQFDGKDRDESSDDDILQTILDDNPTIERGDAPLEISLSYKQLSFQYILQQLLPTHLLPPPSAYEQIGHVAHFNLKPEYADYQHLIGEVLVATTTSIQTVVQKVGQVSGKYRTYDLLILADEYFVAAGGEKHQHNSSLETTVMEDGVSIQLNVAECYWCTRLSGEREQVLREVLLQYPDGYPLVVADVFCGVGAVCLLAAKKRQVATGGSNAKQQQKHSKKKKKDGKNPKPITASSQSNNDVNNSLRIVANDWNPTAIDYFQKSIHANNLDASQFELSCLEAYDFLIALGNPKQDDDESHENDTTNIKSRLPDHVLMNFPLEAPKFLGALRWWSWEQLEHRRHETFGKDAQRLAQFPRFHVYTFARATELGADDEEEVAVDIVTNELLPEIAFGDDENEDHDVAEDSNDSIVTRAIHRRQEFNDEFGTNISTRLVRDVAPGKVVVCVSFSLTPKLVRYMQGDYS